MPPRLFSLLLFACTWPLVTGRTATHELDNSRQCLVVLANDWASTSAEMRAFERGETANSWKQQGPGISVVAGKKGFGQGRGLVRLDFGDAPLKKEGDDRAPAGIFRLSYGFGYAPRYSALWINLPYMPSKQIECIDDPNSRYYNRLVHRLGVAKIDWRSSEQMMLRDDVRYKWGVVVEHNPAAIPGAGSCIFLHVWKTSATLTTGCTAMAESDLVRVLRWLDPSREPILVQMPRANYRALRAKYDLPPDRS
jgi:D-alanyl-D-alanine dipeptidase